MNLGLGLGLGFGSHPASGGPTPPTTNLLSQFDPSAANASGWTDAKGANTLTASAAGITTATDLAGQKVVVFPGTAHYGVAAASGLSGGAITIATVVKTSSAGTKGLVSLSDGAINMSAFGTHLGKDDIIDLVIGESDGTVTINDGAWRFFMLVANKNTPHAANLYVAGVSTPDKTVANACGVGNFGFYIGGDPTRNGDVACSVGMTLVYAADYSSDLTSRQAIYSYFRTLYNNLV